MSSLLSSLISSQLLLASLTALFSVMLPMALVAWMISLHRLLVPIFSFIRVIAATTIRCLYVFVEIKINVEHLVYTVKWNFDTGGKNIVLAGTIQFASAIRVAKFELEKHGFRVLIPQSKPLSAGEVLGCTAPKAFMIANPGMKAFRYDPYLGKLFLDKYDHVGMKESRKNAILKAKGAKNWGIVLGSLGRQGNPRILERLEKNTREKGFDYTVILMSELSPARIGLFEDSVDAWIQIACPHLSIDWGDDFVKPVLTPFGQRLLWS